MRDTFDRFTVILFSFDACVSVRINLSMLSYFGCVISAIFLAVSPSTNGFLQVWSRARQLEKHMTLIKPKK
jgi:hypothetical protein